MLRTAAILFGIILIAVGALGFSEQFYKDGLFLGFFHFNFEHNIVHIVTGIVALLCGFASPKASRLFFQVFGVIYAIIAGIGFYNGNAPIFGMIANNLADAWLHTGIAAISLYLGFCCKCTACKCP